MFESTSNKPAGVLSAQKALHSNQESPSAKQNPSTAAFKTQIHSDELYRKIQQFHDDIQLANDEVSRLDGETEGAEREAVRLRSERAQEQVLKRQLHERLNYSLQDIQVRNQSAKRCRDTYSTVRRMKLEEASRKPLKASEVDTECQELESQMRAAQTELNEKTAQYAALPWAKQIMAEQDQCDVLNAEIQLLQQRASLITHSLHKYNTRNEMFSAYPLRPILIELAAVVLRSEKQKVQVSALREEVQRLKQAQGQQDSAEEEEAMDDTPMHMQTQPMQTNGMDVPSAQTEHQGSDQVRSSLFVQTQQQQHRHNEHQQTVVSVSDLVTDGHEHGQQAGADDQQTAVTMGTAQAQNRVTFSLPHTSHEYEPAVESPMSSLATVGLEEEGDTLNNTCQSDVDLDDLVTPSQSVSQQPPQEHDEEPVSKPALPVPAVQLQQSVGQQSALDSSQLSQTSALSEQSNASSFAAYQAIEKAKMHQGHEADTRTAGLQQDSRPDTPMLDTSVAVGGMASAFGWPKQADHSLNPNPQSFGFADFFGMPNDQANVSAATSSATPADGGFGGFSFGNFGADESTADNTDTTQAAAPFSFAGMF